MKKLSNTDPVDTGLKLSVHKTFRRRPGRLLNVLCTFSLCPVSTEEADLKKALVIKKACTSSLAKFSVFPFLITMLSSRQIRQKKISHKKILLYDSCLVEPQTFSMDL